MDRFKSLALTVAAIGYVTCQMAYFSSPGEIKPMPEKCRLNNLMSRPCCVFPPFFNRDVARECGARFRLNEVFNDSEIAMLRREMLTGCRYWTCVLIKYDLLTKDLVNDEKYFTHLDRWVELNPSFGEVMLNAKVHCKMTFRMMLPVKHCEFNEFHQCIRNFIKMNCPSIIPIPECQEQKEFFEDCREFYY